jgi:hypothetical protein
MLKGLVKGLEYSRAQGFGVFKERANADHHKLSGAFEAIKKNLCVEFRCQNGFGNAALLRPNVPQRCGFKSKW